jgi:hypothetical protein
MYISINSKSHAKSDKRRSKEFAESGLAFFLAFWHDVRIERRNAVWHIDHNGTARAEYDGGRKIVVRRIPGLCKPFWQIIVQGDQSRFPLAYRDRDEAMKQAEMWIQLKEIDARCGCRPSSKSTGLESN